MKRRRSALAVASLVMGLIGLCWVMMRAPILAFLAIPLGMATVICGATAAWRIHRQKTILCGSGMAIAGIVLGSTSSLIGMVASVQRVFHQPRAQGFPMERIARAPTRDESATNFTSNLSIVVLEVQGGNDVSEAQRTLVRAKFFDAKDGRALIADKADHDGFGTINARGHTTRRYPKQSFSFHTTDARGAQVKAPLLGLPAEEDWVLYAPFEDKSMIRDVLAYELSRRMGQYAPRTRYVELFLKNGGRAEGQISMRDYMGVYVLMERIKRDKERVNIAKLGPEDQGEPAITGGYILKRDHSDGDGGRFRTTRGGPYFYVYPKSRDITAEQKAWIRRYFNDFEEALYGEEFADPEKGYAAYLDVDGFIDAHWLIELSKNVDGFRYSAYLTKDRGKKLKPGPAWDWNRAFGNANYYGGGTTRGWYWTVLRPTEICWHERLRQDPAYVARAAERWRELRKGVLDVQSLTDLVDQLASQLEEAQQRNFRRWPLLGEHVASNYFVGETYRDEVEWLKKWIAKRIEWMDSQVAEGTL